MFALGAGAALITLFKIPVCPTARVLRIPCPGCGLSRATIALLQWKLHEAWHLHPLVFLIVPTLGLYIGGQALIFLFPKPTWVHRALQSRVLEWCMMALMVLAIGVWVARFFGAFGGPVPV